MLRERSGHRTSSVARRLLLTSLSDVDLGFSMFGIEDRHLVEVLAHCPGGGRDCSKVSSLSYGTLEWKVQDPER